MQVTTQKEENQVPLELAHEGNNTEVLASDGIVEQETTACIRN